MTCHHLKINSEFLHDIIYDRKQFEIRKNDRNYQVGDRVRVSDGEYYADLLIKYVTDYAQRKGYVVFGFAHLGGGLVNPDRVKNHEQKQQVRSQPKSKGTQKDNRLGSLRPRARIQVSSYSLLQPPPLEL